MIAAAQPPPHAEEAARVADRLSTDPARLVASGPNELSGVEEVSAGRILLDQFMSPMLVLLAGAGVLSAALGEVAESVVIFVVVTLNAWVGFRQEYRAERAMASLRAMVPLYEGAVRLSTQLTYQSPRKRGVGQSLLLNVGLAGEYGFLRYFAGVQNLLDTTVALPVSTEAGDSLVPQYGRTFLIQLSAGF